MSASSSRPSGEDKHLPGEDKKMPAWTASLLTHKFFTPCQVHEQAKNGVDYYCIRCNKTACKECISADVHKHHSAIKIHKYSYQDAVQLNNIKKFMNCSLIQTYRTNRQKVLLLNPLPHHGTKADGDICCRVCARKLKDGSKFIYCSIACKVEAQGISEKPKKTGASRRKGTPHRAPLC